jgi:Flp pilus assembly protein TadD
MKPPFNPREHLTRRLLEVGEGASDQSLNRDHLEDELLAQFCDGTLPASDRDEVVIHLADCRDCRSIVANVLHAAEEAPEARATISLPQRGAWYSNMRIMLAAAAAVLLLVTVWLLRGPGRTGEQVAYLTAKEALISGQFDRVESILNEANRQGAKSDRLISLRSQAKREIANPLALAAAGRLSDFGYDIGGVVARDPAALPHRTGLAAADELLANSQSKDLEMILNRGHLLLSEQKPKEALAEFEKAQKIAPKESLVWLGGGIAKFLLDDFARAESDFRHAQQLDPSNLDVQINLAMTLEEAGKTAEAITVWQELLKRQLDEDLRRKIESDIQRLKQERAN